MSRLTWDMIDVHDGALGHCPPGAVLMYMHVCKRDRTRCLVFMGGLGALRVGHMWLPDDEHNRKYPGYDDAPEAKCQPAEADLINWAWERSDTPTEGA